MNKGNIVLGAAVALLCSGLIWTAGSKDDSGIAGWETVNVGMAQAIGLTDSNGASAAAGGITGAGEGAAQSVEAGKGAESPQGVKGTESVLGEGAAGAGVQAGGVPAAVQSGGQTAAAAGAGGTAAVSPAPPAAAEEGKTNVNTADAAQLMNLPGIGEKKAQAIIDYRNAKGVFRSLSDLGKVKGIGPKMLEKLKPLVLF